MYVLRRLVLAASLLASSALAQKQQEGYLGFNSGATRDNNQPKHQDDYEKEFKTARSLLNSPGSFNSVRLYTNVQSQTTADPISAFPAALATNTTMLLGIWCSGTSDINNELTALDAALTKYGKPFADLVVGISVGSEDMYRISEDGIKNKAGIGNGPKEVVDFIKQVRAKIKGTALADKPVGHVDAWSAWSNKSNADVLKAVDFVGTDLYPYYEKDKGNDFSNVTAVFDYIYNKTLTAAGDKPVWITETGWPSKGPTSGQAVPSVDNAKGFWDQIGCTLFGRQNVWWYNLRDSNPANKEKFGLSPELSVKPIFNLTCPAGSGAPASINNNIPSFAPAATRVSSPAVYFSIFVFASFLGWST